LLQTSQGTQGAEVSEHHQAASSPWLQSQQHPPCKCGTQQELGRKSIAVPTKPLKASENVPTPHQEQTKTSRNFHEKPKTLPNGLQWHETSWGVGRRAKVFFSAG